MILTLLGYFFSFILRYTQKCVLCFYLIAPRLGTGISMFVAIANGSKFSMVFLIVLFIRFLGLLFYAAWDTRKRKAKAQKYASPPVADGGAVANQTV